VARTKPSPDSSRPLRTVTGRRRPCGHSVALSRCGRERLPRWRHFRHLIAFFLQGARLSRGAVVGGIAHWRLHATIGATTFILFPLTGWCLITIFPHFLPQPLWLGVIFLCALPSTVQSSIALASIGQGNVAGAVCSATASNVVGIGLTPLILTVMSRHHGAGIALQNVELVILELLVPFAVGHLLRPYIGAWAERSRRTLAITDRGSILFVVYASFSGAVVNGVWQDLPPVTLALLGLVVSLLLVLVLITVVTASRAQGFTTPDEVAAVLCGSQKSLVSGVPIASALFSGPITQCSLWSARGWRNATRAHRPTS